MTGSYTSPLTNRLLLDARVSDIVQGWKDRYPSGGNSLEFTKPLPDVFKSLIAVTEQGGMIPNLLYRGAGQTGLGPFIRVQGYIASAQASLSYVTGAHALKVGFLDTWGTRHVDYENIDSNVRYRFNNGVPNQITQVATPYGFTNQLGSELGVYAQDKWTLDRLTLNLGARFDYLNINFPEQHLGPGVLVPNRDITFPGNDYLGWKRHFPTARRRLRPVRQREDGAQGQPRPLRHRAASDQRLHGPRQSGQRDGQLGDPILERPCGTGHQRRLHPAVRSAESRWRTASAGPSATRGSASRSPARCPIRRCSMAGASGRTSGSSKPASSTNCCRGSAWRSATSAAGMATSR